MTVEVADIQGQEEGGALDRFLALDIGHLNSHRRHLQRLPEDLSGRRALGRRL